MVCEGLGRYREISMAAIELNNLVKRYGVGARAVQVLHGVSAEIHDGEFVVIVGPSISASLRICITLL